jgi:hypothetical protein
MLGLVDVLGLLSDQLGAVAGAVVAVALDRQLSKKS